MHLAVRFSIAGAEANVVNDEVARQRPGTKPNIRADACRLHRLRLRWLIRVSHLANILHCIAEDPGIRATRIEHASDRLRRIANKKVTDVHLIIQVVLEDVRFDFLAVLVNRAFGDCIDRNAGVC